MGFSGGGSNVLKPHKHDGTVVQDGGSLDFDNITQADLTAGDVIFSNGTHLQRLAIGTPAQQIKVNAGATAPEYFTPAAGASTWTEVINEFDNVAANTFDTGYVDLGSYRVLRLFWSSFVSSGSSTNAFQMRFYDPDGNVASGAVQGTAGFFNNTFYSNGNQTELDMTFGQSISANNPIVCGMEILCSGVGKPGGGFTGGTFFITQRLSYDALYCQGSFHLVDGFTASDLMFCNGFQEQSGNTYQDSILTVLGMGDNTS